jgi:hypothetical protein
MAASRRAGRTATGTRSAPAAAAEQVTPGVDPAFHRAILKIALELRRPSGRGYDAVVDETIRAMRLDGKAFRRYLGENGAANMSLLLATARRFGP